MIYAKIGDDGYVSDFLLDSLGNNDLATYNMNDDVTLFIHNYRLYRNYDGTLKLDHDYRFAKENEWERITYEHPTLGEKTYLAKNEVYKQTAITEIIEESK